MERESSVCIRFEQLRASQLNAEAMGTRQQIRAKLVDVLNKIQQVSGVDNAPFVATDVSYIAYVKQREQARRYHCHPEANKGDA
jgi:hypothetical protein